MKSKVTWCDTTLVKTPIHYGLCLRESDFHAELRRMGVPRDHWPPFIRTAHADATAHHFESTSEYRDATIVCVDMERAKKRDPLEVVGLLVHEAMHIWQRIREHIGETNPSSEFEAYSVQWIVQELCGAYRDALDR